jgi:general stress protein 26
MADRSIDLKDPWLQEFWRERHLCTVTLLKSDGRAHVIPMGVALSDEPDTAWAITSGNSFKARLLREPGPIAVCQVDGGRWATLHGIASVRTDEASVEEAVRWYASRYRQPSPNPERVALHISVEKMIGSVPSR